MKSNLIRLVAAMLLACGIAPLSAQSPRAAMRPFVDMAGRTVWVPTRIHRVLGMSPVGTVLIYTLAPQMLAGWNYQPDPGELEFYKQPYRSLPVLGGWFGKNNTGNLEVIIKAHPDVLISMGDPMGVATAERVQQQTGIPVVYLDGDLRKLPEAYREAGELLGVQDRAGDLAAECQRILDSVSKKVAAIPAAKRRRVYYAEGPTGLETEPGNSIHSEVLDFVGAINVAEVPNQRGYGHTPVSMEQILLWNPEVVISGYDHSGKPGVPGDFYRSVWNNPVWRHVQAVRNREVYEVPQYPFCWIDRPPSVNRIIGIVWLANLLYPDLFHDDLRAVTREFYSKFYHWQLSDAQLNQILATATRRSK